MIRTESKAKAVQAAEPRACKHNWIPHYPMGSGIPDWFVCGTCDAQKPNPEFEPRGRGRPASGKVVVSIRLDPAVIAKFKATGDGWQARMNDVLMAAEV